MSNLKAYVDLSLLQHCWAYTRHSGAAAAAAAAYTLPAGISVF